MQKKRYVIDLIRSTTALLAWGLIKKRPHKDHDETIAFQTIALRVTTAMAAAAVKLWSPSRIECGIQDGRRARFRFQSLCAVARAGLSANQRAPFSRHAIGPFCRRVRSQSISRAICSIVYDTTAIRYRNNYPSSAWATLILFLRDFISIS